MLHTCGNGKNGTRSEPRWDDAGVGPHETNGAGEIGTQKRRTEVVMTAQEFAPAGVVFGG